MRTAGPARIMSYALVLLLFPTGLDLVARDEVGGVRFVSSKDLRAFSLSQLHDPVGADASHLAGSLVQSIR